MTLHPLMPISGLTSYSLLKHRASKKSLFVGSNILECFLEQSPATPNGLRKLTGVFSCSPYPLFSFLFFNSAFRPLPSSIFHNRISISSCNGLSHFSPCRYCRGGREYGSAPEMYPNFRTEHLKLLIRETTCNKPVVASEGSANSKKRKLSPQSLSGLCFKRAFVNWLLGTQTSFFLIDTAAYYVFCSSGQLSLGSLLNL